MSVASLYLCRQLYELSGWDDIYTRWCGYTHQEPQVWNRDEISDRQVAEFAVEVPAYDLGYLLRKLPDVTHMTCYERNRITAKYQCFFRVGYDSDSDEMIHTEADTPEDAACKLVIELFKRGILPRSAA